MLEKIQISHYKSISEAVLELRNVNVLTGINSVGKSNIIDTLSFLRDLSVNGIDYAISKRHGIDSIRQWSKSRPYHITLHANYTDSTGYGFYKITLGSMKGEYRILKEEGSWTTRIPRGSKNLTRYLNSRFSRSNEHIVTIKHSGQTILSKEDDIEFKNEKDESFISSLRAASRGFFGALPALWREMSDFHSYSIFPNTLRQTQNPSNDRQLSESGSNLASIFKSMQKTRFGQRGRQEIIYLLQKVMPNLENIQIQNLGGYLIPSFRVFEKDNQFHDLNVSQVSDGFLRLLGILTALYQPALPKVIAIEEPEQTVHPGVLPLLADAIKEASKRSKILITTHSPSLLDQFDTDNILSVSSGERGTEVSSLRADQIEAVKKQLFSVGELMQMEGL